MMSIVMLMDPDGQRMWPVAPSRVPGGFVKAISPSMIGQNMGSCGAAAFREERVIISDVANDPLWSDLCDGQSREVALAYGLRAVWSQPLISKDDEVLGTFGLFHASPRSPSSRELRLIEDAGHIAVIATWTRSTGKLTQVSTKPGQVQVSTTDTRVLEELRGELKRRRTTSARSYL